MPLINPRVGADQYDLENDPDEKHNLYGQPAYQQLTAHLKERLIALRKETGDQFQYRPTGLPLHAPAAGSETERKPQ